jgi:hypothetical protein
LYRVELIRFFESHRNIRFFSTTAERVSLTEALRASQEQSAALNQAFNSLRVNADQLSARVADLEAKNTAAAAEARQRTAEIQVCPLSVVFSLFTCLLNNSCLQLLRTAAAAREEALSQATQRCARAVSTADERERDCQRWRDKVTSFHRDSISTFCLLNTSFCQFRCND